MEKLFIPSRRGNSVTLKKTELIEKARAGYSFNKDRFGRKSRSKRIKRLFYCYTTYISPHHEMYDKVFVDTIQAIRPDWLDPVKHKTDLRKQNALDLAASNPQSLCRSDAVSGGLSSSIGEWTNPISTLYDESFSQKMAELNYHWLSKELRLFYTVKDYEKFFLENYRFPSHVKVKYKNDPDLAREGYLSYWMRDYSRTKRWSKHRKRPRSKMKKVEEYIKDTVLPNDLLKLDLRYFNVSMRNLEELGEFYKENGRLPRIMQGRNAHDGSNVVSEDEKRLCRWLRSRRTEEGRNKKWRIVAKPLVKKLGLPTNTFKPQKVEK